MNSEIIRVYMDKNTNKQIYIGKNKIIKVIRATLDLASMGAGGGAYVYFSDGNLSHNYFEWAFLIKKYWCLSQVGNIEDGFSEYVNYKMRNDYLWIDLDSAFVSYIDVFIEVITDDL